MKRETAAAPSLPLLAHYRAPWNSPDELLDSRGAIRPVWRAFVDDLSRLPAEEVSLRFARGDQYLRDAGVFYRRYGDEEAADRAWPLSHIPVLIAEEEWTAITQALTQRAELLEAIAADLYGEAHLVRDGILPPALIAASPEWLRPLVGVTPHAGHFLSFLAFEIGRGPDGAWWVLGDRTQAPAGAGFALENRLATTHVFSDLQARASVRPLDDFFRAFREALFAQRPDGNGAAAILSPGPMADTYSEHAYIARHLGLLLLEGEDLAIENGRVHVRTVDGLNPIGLLWRRLDASFADPLELNEHSQIGTPGLVSALRNGSVAMVNALGVGVLESRALMAFMPRVCEAVRGEALKMPNIATWWCGQKAERDYVLANAERMMFAPALSTGLPFEAAAQRSLANVLGEGGRDLAGALARRGGGIVAQEAVQLSTTPAYAGGQLEPRPINLRVFLARTQAGWIAMPGGYARIGRAGQADVVSMQQGGAVADVWVIGPAAGAPPAPPSVSATPVARSRPGSLPSRAADNLFWLGRYVERAESLMRLKRAYHVRLAETGDSQLPVLLHLENFLTFRRAFLDAAPTGISGVLAAALTSAGRVRDRFSVDGWLALNDVTHSARALATLPPGHETAHTLNHLLREIAGFFGLVHENMMRTTGWRFMGTGRSLERAMQIASLLGEYTQPGVPDGALDVAIEVGDSAMAHRRLFAMEVNRTNVLDLLAFDLRNPRALLSLLADFKEQVAALPHAVEDGAMSPLLRAAHQIHGDLAVESAQSVTTSALFKVWGDLAAFSELLSDTYFR
ncbi:MAG: hypothetical protein GC199_05585 [Alphaproteobacteria bacterium]|nr:hypothetical protein [Alphaproteobacteria bacterium]